MVPAEVSVTNMASCPKCGRGKIRKRRDMKKCKNCGPLPGYERKIMTREIKLLPDEYYPIRDDLYGALERYLNHGINPGSFLTAVLENDLKEAFGRADIMNSANLKNIVGYIYNHLPSNSWGSKERVADYLASLRKENVAC